MFLKMYEVVRTETKGINAKLRKFEFYCCYLPTYFITGVPGIPLCTEKYYSHCGLD